MYLDSITAMSFVWIQWTNNFNNTVRSILMSESLVTVSMVLLLGRELLFVIGLYCSLEKSLTGLLWQKKSLTNSLFTREVVINGIFEQLANVFKIDQ